MPKMTIQEYARRYGTRGTEMIVEELILRAPAFPGDKEIAKALGVMMADLREVLEEAHPTKGMKS